MNLAYLLQPAFLCAYVACVAGLFLLARLWRGWRGTAILWLTATVMLGGIIAGTIAGLVKVILTLLPPNHSETPWPPEMIVIVSGLLLIAVILVRRAVRNRPPSPLSRVATVGWVAACLIVFHLAFVLIALAQGTAVVFKVMDPEGKPVTGAKFTFHTGLGLEIATPFTDNAGTLVLRLTDSEFVEGEFTAPSPLLGSTHLTVWSHYGWGVRNTTFERRWNTTFGLESCQVYSQTSSRLSDGPHATVEVFLPWKDKAALLPYYHLTHLNEKLRKVQDEQNTLVYMHFPKNTLEAYVQLRQLAAIGDSTKDLDRAVRLIFAALGDQNKQLMALLNRATSDELTVPERDWVLSQMISVLAIPEPPGTTLEGKAALVRQRLNDDVAVLEAIDTHS